MDCIVDGVTKSWTRLSDFLFLCSDCPGGRGGEGSCAPCFPAGALPGSSTNQKATLPAHPAGKPPHPTRTGAAWVVPGPRAVVPPQTDERSARPVSSVQLARGLAPGGTTPDELQSSQSWTVSTFQRGCQDPVSGEMQQSWPRAS